jgi:hypothetical protein
LSAARFKTFVCGTALILIGCSTQHVPVRESDITRREALVRSIGEESNYGMFAVDNSIVVIQSFGVDRVVAEGPPIVPLLVRRMKEKDVDFDTFIRCYSAAEQIATASGKSEDITWCGGASREEGKFGPGGMPYDDDFRNMVIESIETTFALRATPIQ